MRLYRSPRQLSIIYTTPVGSKRIEKRIVKITYPKQTCTSLRVSSLTNEFGCKVRVSAGTKSGDWRDDLKARLCYEKIPKYAGFLSACGHLFAQVVLGACVRHDEIK